MLTKAAQQPLIFTPAVGPREVMLAYLLRLSEENGYTNPADILRYAGLRALHGAGIPNPKDLQTVLGWTDAQLQTAYPHLMTLNGKRSKHELLGHTLGSLYVQVWRPKICATCIHERGYHLPEWHLTDVISCAAHQHMLITHCGRCKKALRWFRQGLLVCTCGASLGDVPLTRVSDPIARIVDVLVRKLYRQGLQGSPADKAGYPIGELSSIDLPDLLRLMSQLNRRRSREARRRAHRVATEDIAAKLLFCDQIFREWPKGWHAWLDTLEPLREGQTDSAGLHHRYAAIYDTVFDVRYRGKGIEFLHQEFLKYVLENKDYYVGNRILRSAKVISRRDRWLGVDQCADLLGIDRRAVSRLAQQGFIKQKEARIGKATRTLYFVDSASIVAAPEQVMYQREAAAYVGMPVSVLRALRQNNTYKDRGIRTDPRGYLRSSLDDLKASLVIGLPESIGNSFDRNTDTTLDSALRNRKLKANVKADLVLAVLNRTFTSLRVIDKASPTIVMPRAEVIAFIQDRRIGENCGRPLQQTANLIGGDCASTMGLIKQQLLIARKKGNSWIVDSESLRKFVSTYVWTGELAAELHTTSKPIISFAYAHGLNVIAVPTHQVGKRCYFVARKDVADLKKRMAAWKEMWRL